MALPPQLAADNLVSKDRLASSPASFDNTIQSPMKTCESMKALSHKGNEHTRNIWVKLPDLFTSIMSKDPVVNTHYKASKVASDEWLHRLLPHHPDLLSTTTCIDQTSALAMSPETAHKWDKLDIAYMSAICAPNADVETLTLMNDWNGWVFAFDDQFDEGHLQQDVTQAAQQIVNTISLLDDISPIVPADQDPLRHTLQSCWLRFRKRAGPELQYRWKQHLTWYCLGVLRQVGMQAVSYNSTVEEYMDFRSGCVGVYPCIGLMEYAEGINIPHLVAEHPSLREIARLTCDLVTLQNDVCSYRKDLEEGGKNNIILLLKKQGLTDQQAMDNIGEMVEHCYQRWHAALDDLPSCDDGTNRDVLRYVNGCRNIALGNLHWSFYTPRYLKDEGQRIKETRMMRLS